MNDDLGHWLIQNAGFCRQYQLLTRDSVLASFPMIMSDIGQCKTGHDWGYLISAASILAQSKDTNAQDAALRIAQYALVQKNGPRHFHDAAVVVLDVMANKPAISLALSRGLVSHEIEQRLPFSLYQEWICRSLQNIIRTSKAEEIPVNRFQKKFWAYANEFAWLSVSAPTSAGKSFILERWIADYLRCHPNATIVYLVPTRALIHQVQLDLDQLLTKENLLGVAISTLPLEASLVALSCVSWKWTFDLPI